MGADGVNPAPLAFEGIKTSHGYVRLAVYGEIDLSNAERLRKTLAAILDEPDLSRLDLDFGGLAFIDSQGITALIGALRRARTRRIHFGVVNAHGPVLRVLEIVGVDKLLITPASAPEPNPGASAAAGDDLS